MADETDDATTPLRTDEADEATTPLRQDTEADEQRVPLDTSLTSPSAAGVGDARRRTLRRMFGKREGGTASRSSSA